MQRMLLLPQFSTFGNTSAHVQLRPGGMQEKFAEVKAIFFFSAFLACYRDSNIRDHGEGGPSGNFWPWGVAVTRRNEKRIGFFVVFTPSSSLNLLRS